MQVVSFAACLCLGIFIGRPCEVYGLRVVVSAGGILSFAGLMGASFCKSIPALIATQGLLAGIGGACRKHVLAFVSTHTKYF